jgi:hypothetical protein
VPKCEIPKPKKKGTSLGVLDTGISVTGRWRCQRLTSSGVPKCRNVKTRNRRIAWSVGYRDFGYREMEMSETHIIRSPEVPKCENPKQAHRLEYWIPGFRIPGDGNDKDSHHKESRSRETRSREMIKTPYRSFGYRE